MALEDLTGTSKYLGALVLTNPVASDDRREGDDHIRGVKNVLKNTFPSLNAAWAGLNISGGRVLTGFPLGVPDGTSAAPGYSFAAGTGAGMYRAAAAVGLTNGGTGRLEIFDGGFKFGAGAVQAAIDGGVYTPTVTPGANVASVTPVPGCWFRIGNNVLVSLAVTIDPTAASVATTINLSLPVASDLTSPIHCIGSALRNTGAVGNQLVTTVFGDAANNNASMTFLNDTDVAARNWYLNFMYIVF
jgi:hypothetical protein